MIAKLVACGAFAMLSSTCLPASAGVMSSLNKADFVLTAVYFPYTPAFTNNDIVSNGGLMRLDNAQGIGQPRTGTHAYYDFSGSVLPGQEYVMNGDENFDVLFSSAQTAFAFDYEDDSFNSLFTLNFFNGSVNVGTIAFTSTSPFNTPKFIGFFSDTPFTKVTVRENDGSLNSNEYFQFYSARIVPEPASFAIFLVGAVLAAYPRRPRNRLQPIR